MCFGGSQPATPAPVTPAPAPPPPQPAPDDPEINQGRRDEEQATFGSGGPTTRVDRSATGGVVGGSGLNM